jgi:serine/threonine protein kinase
MNSLIGRSLGRYHILEQLGEGGMAIVYKAFDTSLERNVAIKIIRKEAFPPEQLDSILRRFEREAKALARLSHPNIVKVHDYGEFEGSPYLVMEYLPGGTLKESIEKNKYQPVSWQSSARLLLPMARALAYAHQQGILHRDVKPSNIMITATGDPMLTDFGIAKILEAEEAQGLTRSGTGIGTPEYMAPEQGKGEKVDARADIYSLGIVYYEMVTGRRPYIADTPMAVVIKQINDPLPNPRDFVHDLPENVERVILKALAKQPENRYPEMNAFANALEAIASAPAETLIARVNEEKTLIAKGKPRQSIEYPQLLLPKGKVWWPWAAGVGGLLIVTIIVAALVTLKLFPHPAITPTSTQQSLDLETTTPTIAAPTTGITALPPTPAPGSTQVRPSDGSVMIYIPVGSFNMGQTAEQALAECQKFFNDCQLSWFADEQPPHSVSLEAYWIDRTEVTNSAYAQCVSAGACLPPAGVFSKTRSSYYGNPQFADYPVINVDWERAKGFCEWAGGRLPTEAEWENAARGTDGRTYPWGNASPTCSLVNFGEPKMCTGDTSRVGSYPDGASVYGLLDMAGNVSEWVHDWYSDTTYTQLPQDNPTGPITGEAKVLRGGAWNLNPNFLRTTNRDHQVQAAYNDHIGFRCALPAK